MTWSEFIAILEERGLTPEDVAQIIYYYEVNHGRLDYELTFGYNNEKAFGGVRRD